MSTDLLEWVDRSNPALKELCKCFEALLKETQELMELIHAVLPI